MKRVPLSLFLVFLAAAAVGCATAIVDPAIPPSRPDVVGTWLGYSVGEVEFLLLQCDEDGRGYLAVSYVRDQPPSVYRIENWRLRGWNLEMSARPVDEDAEAIFLQHVAYSYEALRLEFGGMSWKRSAVPLREAAFSARASGARERIDAYRKDRNR